MQRRTAPAAKAAKKNGTVHIAPYSLSLWFDRGTQMWRWSVHDKSRVVKEGQDAIHIDANKQALSALNRFLVHKVLK